MRKIVLVTAMVLMSASAQAAGSRSLSLASANDPVAVPSSAQPAATQVSEVAPAADSAQQADRPSAAPAVTPGAVAAATPPAPAKSKPKAEHKAESKHGWTERRIISELHRHGIYW